MSNAAQNAVWTHSKTSGTALIVMLAIADHINEAGVAYPSVSTLARKCRLKERQVQNLLRKLIAIGEVSIDRGGGRRRPNLYQIHLPAVETVQSTAPLPAERVQSSVNTPAETVHYSAPLTAETVQSGVKPAETVQPIAPLPTERVQYIAPFTAPERVQFDAKTAETVQFRAQRVQSIAPKPNESDLIDLDLISPLTPQPVSQPAQPPAPPPVAEPPLLEINSAFAMAMVTTPDSDRAERHPAFADTCRHFENSFARFLTPDLTDAIDGWLKQYLADWVTEAIADAAQRRISHPKPYIAKMLENWKVAGKREKLASANSAPTLLARSMNQTQRRRTPAGGPPHATPAPVSTAHTREQLDFIAAVQAKNRAWREANLEPAGR